LLLSRLNDLYAQLIEGAIRSVETIARGIRQ
jgi:hypothetical protein